MKMENTVLTFKAFDALVKFANQRPGFNFADYGDYKYYRQDYNLCRKQKEMFDRLQIEILRCMYPHDIEKMILEKYSKSVSGKRLVYNPENNKWEYTTGQYFPTEYRGAAGRILWEILWCHAYDLYKSDVKKHMLRIVGKKVFNFFY